ncbi:hypothetical protein BN938_2225 [Mucinivorans hirudinis]|uniref:Dipeptidyl-peptidase n=1 Tax=Mucinivorans hirudinis TaxID=1433126 RepID=A0A060R9N4_9BACT|nr:hypothetical protein BN938_2225 [Mucinivorans hirudinis]
MKKILVTGLIIFSFLSTRADEGMWLPSLLGEGRIKEMKAKGLKLTAEDLYSINKASLKDAIVRFGGGCTGELISDKGLMITNHHCGYGQIQAHSTVQNDYLTYGFAAMNQGQELPNPGLTVSFLQEMKDVTPQALAGVTAQMNEKERQGKIKANIKGIVEAATKDNGLKATVESLYYGNQYFLFLYKVYEDVRLVFAPPSSIGKFGGDTDNWMWPRHTGDFSIFRIYADGNNEPAKYSPKNVPFKPKKSLAISTKGIKEGDFTFVYGFPGRTNEYLHSEAVRYIEEIGNPLKIDLRTRRLDIMNREQAKDAAVRIQYAAKNAGVSNAWKKWQGEVIGVKRLNTVKNKKKLEEDFIKWSADKPEYKGTVEKFDALYKELEPYAFARDFYMEAPQAMELLRFAGAFGDTARVKKDAVEKFYKDYFQPIDKETTYALLSLIKKNLDKNFLPDIFVNTPSDKLLDNIYATSIFVDKNKVLELIDAPNYKEIVEADPAFVLAKSFNEKMKKDITPKYNEINQQIELLYRTYMRGLMAMQPNRPFYPDANSTLRVAYGKVDGYQPRDAVYYQPVSTLDGVMQKDNPDIYDYDVPEKLREIYATKDYGRWAVNGTVPVAFIASNHTTGGNSGSPVLNAGGELIGVNFDRCWEGTMSDIQYDPVVCRNIAIDIRYVLFIIDKLGGAGYLIDEMVIK